MSTKIFQLDAFTDRLFAGNPAAVVPLESFPEDPWMQAVAAENNLSETAYLVAENGDYRLRWFTPAAEVPLCGHATLASAAVVMEKLEPGRTSVIFHTASGPLTVRRVGIGYVMDFPAKPAQPVTAPAGLAEALGATPKEVLANDFNYLAVLDSAAAVRELSPDFSALAKLDRPGIMVTAEGDSDYDFISRYFAPVKGVPEDPVTGSAHCALAPYWQGRFGKSEFRAFQASPRGGELICRVIGQRVELEGKCVFFMEGQLR